LHALFPISISRGFPWATQKLHAPIYIEDGQLDALKRLSQRTKVPQSVYVREALDMLLEKYSDQLKLDFKESFKEDGILKVGNVLCRPSRTILSLRGE